MKFFTPKKEFTHFGRIEGVPCYISYPKDEAPIIAGTNIIFDAAIRWLVPFIHWLRVAATVLLLRPDDRHEYCDGWLIEVRGEL